jgi:hypothetical protein
VLEARAICDACGHTGDWHDREAVRARLRSDPPIERPCYREIGGALCPCGGFRDSGTLVVPAGALSTRGSASGFAIARVAVLALLLVILGLGLLYAYRSQTPAVPQVDTRQALQDVNAGRVRAVTISAGKATLEFRDSPSPKEQTTLPDQDTILVKAVADYNAATPSQAIELRYVSESQPVSVVGSVILSLLPVLLIGGLFYYLMTKARRVS